MDNFDKAQQQYEAEPETPKLLCVICDDEPPEGKSKLCEHCKDGIADKFKAILKQFGADEVEYLNDEYIPENSLY